MAEPAAGIMASAYSKSDAYSDLVNAAAGIPRVQTQGFKSVPMVSCTGTNTPVTFVIELWSIGVESRAVGAFSSRVGEGRLRCHESVSHGYFLSLASQR
jgi:hypothetical protein